MLLDGAAEGGPAHKAGVRGGDVIVELDGVPIEDLRAYAEVLETLVPGETIKITVLRDNQRHTFDLTPGRRD